MSANRRPPGAPLKVSSTPKAISMYPNPRPRLAAVLVAVSISPRQRAGDPPAVERECGDEVEAEDEQVDVLDLHPAAARDERLSELVREDAREQEQRAREAERIGGGRRDPVHLARVVAGANRPGDQRDDDQCRSEVGSQLANGSRQPRQVEDERFVLMLYFDECLPYWSASADTDSVSPGPAEGLSEELCRHERKRSRCLRLREAGPCVVRV
jgi:hypothetical protein